MMSFTIENEIRNVTGNSDTDMRYAPTGRQFGYINVRIPVRLARWGMAGCLWLQCYWNRINHPS